MVLLFVLVLIWSWIGDFREAQRGGGAAGGTTEASGETTPSPETDETQIEDPPEGRGALIVIVDGLNLRAGSERGSRSLKVLSEGTELQILQKDGVWYKVEHPDGVTGYVMGDDEYVRVE